VGRSKYGCATAGKLFERRLTKKGYLSLVHGFVDPAECVKLPYCRVVDSIPEDHQLMVWEALQLRDHLLPSHSAATLYTEPECMSIAFCALFFLTVHSGYRIGSAHETCSHAHRRLCVSRTRAADDR
jgi:hypothetical protein